MALYVVAFLLPAFIAIIAVPLVRGAVPPNWWYGFRTPKTLSSPEIWYPANRRSGWYLIAASAATFCFNLTLMTLHDDWPQVRLIVWAGTALAVSTLLATAASLIYLRRL